MKKHLQKAFSPRNLLVSSMATLLLGFGIPSCKKDSSLEHESSKETSSHVKSHHEPLASQKPEAEYDDQAQMAEQDSSPVVIQFKNGKTVTKNQIEKTAKDIIAQSPYGSINPSDLPDQIYNSLIDQVIEGEIIECRAIETKLYSKPEFKEDFAKIVAMIKKAKASEFFAKEVKSQMKNVSDSEIEAYYNNNLSNYTKSAGGTETAMVSFDSAEQANDFLSAFNSDGRSNSAESMKALQAEMKVGEYKSFGRITNEMLKGEDQKASPFGFPRTNAPKAVLKFVKQTKKTPSSGIVELETGKSAVVVCADHTEPSYYSLAEVKSHVKQIIEQEKMQSEYKSKIADMNKKYVSKIDKKPLEKAKKASSNGQQDLMSQLAAAQGLGDGMSEDDLQKSLAELQNMDPEELNAIAESLGK